MPESAITSGCIDFILAPEDIAHEIERISQAPRSVKTDACVGSNIKEKIP
jgi:chemotaxis response regulator CheB